MKVVTEYAHHDPKFRRSAKFIREHAPRDAREQWHAAIADQPELQEYLRRAYELGTDFAAMGLDVAARALAARSS